MSMEVEIKLSMKPFSFESHCGRLILKGYYESDFMILVFIFALIGLCISIYAYMVEQKIKIDPTYKAACDLSDRISCTKPLLSPYAHLFYYSNATFGIIYYIVVAALAYLNAVNVLFLVALAGCLVSLYLAYILYVKIKSLCIVCTSLYLINFLILGAVLYQLALA